MEKDYFLDRPAEIMYRNNLANGTKVFICTKQMQPYAKELKDLNLITVTANLTSTALHSRGQKVMGEEIATDNYGNVLLNSNGGVIKKENKGRCTYILSPDGTAILTKEGYKYLTTFIDNDGTMKYKVLSEKQIIGKYKLVAVFTLNPEFEFKIPLCKYKYFNSIEELRKTAESFVISDVFLHNGFITLNFNQNTIKVDDVFAEYGVEKQVKLSDEEFLRHLTDSYIPFNNTNYAFNRKYKLEFSHYIAEEY